MPRLRLTAEAIKALEAPAPGAAGATRQAIYYDELQPGLGVRVTSGGARTFVVEGSIAGDTVRVKLGACSDLTLTQARTRAQTVRGQMAAGINPNAKKKADRARSVTLAEAFEAYVAMRKAARRLAPRTEYDYRRILYGALADDGSRRFDGYLSSWRTLALSSITPEMIARRHAELLNRSGAWANHAMRMLSAVCNFAGARYRAAGEPLLARNPVKILSDMKAWYRVPRRSSVIRPHELKAWFAAVRELRSASNNNHAEAVRNYLQVLVLTGLRRGEAARLKWADVDLEARLFTVRGTKNGTDHTLPLSDYLVELLGTAAREAKGRAAQYVFPGAGAEGYLVEPKKLLTKVREASGVAFTLHDLRRTFATIAESLDLPAYAIKRLLNHKMANDVTAGYIVTDVERLRSPMQRITDFMLRAAGLRASAEVVELQGQRTGTDN